MTDKQKHQLRIYKSGKINRENLLSVFPDDPKQYEDFTAIEVRNAIESADPDKLNDSILLMWLSADLLTFTDLLNELLVNPNHTRHQYVAKALQDHIKSPSSIPYIETALATHFDYLTYTCSDSGVIAKWFSWLLYEIGTPEAIAVMQRYSEDQDEGIRNEMRYRLNKVH